MNDNAISRPGVLRAKTWFAQVCSPGAPATLEAQAAFIRQFMAQLFADLDAGRLPGAQSAHFHRLRHEVRFRLIAPPPLESLVADIEERLRTATAAGVITGFRSEPDGLWGSPDPAYGTEVPDVPAAFTQFLESVSRSTIALLKTTADFRVSEQILWNWLHLVHNPMTGLERHLVEVAPHAAVHRL